MKDGLLKNQQIQRRLNGLYANIPIAQMITPKLIGLHLILTIFGITELH